MVDDVDEYHTLQQMLEANNVFDPRMKIDEMRTLCAMLQEPGLDVQPEVDRGAAPDNDTIDIVKQLFANHKQKLLESESKLQGIASPPKPPVVCIQQEESKFDEQTTAENQIESQVQKGGNGRKLRNRVPKNYANQMEKTEMRTQTRRQRKQEDEEHRKLRCFLQERDLYKPPMDIAEMRAVCQAIEQSMQDMTLKQREPEFEDWTYLVDHRQTEPLREDNWQLPSELNPIFVDDIFDTEPSAVSPPTVPCVAAKSPGLLESPPASKSAVLTLSVPPNVDSDSETEYSPDNPGPCCKVIHVVHVEVHPEPREDRPDESPQNACTRVNSSLLSRSVPTDAWDAIDEFF